MKPDRDFEGLREALATAVAHGFPGVKLEDFPEDSEVAGVKVLLETRRGLADIFLYQGGALDLEAVEKSSERVLMRVHKDVVTREDLTATIAELTRALS